MHARDHWKKGILLKEAPHYFAPPKLRAQYDEPPIPPQKTLRGFQLMAKEIIPAGERQDFLKKLQPIQEYFEITQVRGTIELQMRERLLDALRRTRLIAYGFSLPRKPTNIRERIPDDLFRPEFVSWGKSSVKGAGLEFESVLVFRPKWTSEIESQLSQVARRAIGRPSSRGAITEAIGSLISAGWSPSGSRKRDYDLIRTEVHKLFPGQFAENKNLSDKTIAKYLGSEIARFRPAKRPSPKP